VAEIVAYLSDLVSFPQFADTNVAFLYSQIPNVAAYNVDDLKAVVAKNTAMRQREMVEAENLLREEAAQFCAWRESLSAIPTINQLQERANSYREQELDKCTRKLANANLSEKELEAVERLSRGIVNKLLHGPMAHLRKTESIEGKQQTLKELNAMFRLEEEAKPTEPHAAEHRRQFQSMFEGSGLSLLPTHAIRIAVPLFSLLERLSENKRRRNGGINT